MSAPVISDVAEGSPACDAGLLVGDELLSINGVVPLDVIEYQQLVDNSVVELIVRRSDALIDRKVIITKNAGAPLGVRVDSAVFDRIRTCDNHCEFCFIYQLPKGMRKSLYLKDDDYRLSFLYGNFTTLTRFTELDAERVLTERLSPLYVSIHTTNPALRSAMLRNPRGATSLQWLSHLLEGGIEIHGQIVVCPGVNDDAHLEETLLDILDRFSALCSVGIVPLGISDHSNEPAMRAHSVEEAQRTIDLVEQYGTVSESLLGRRLFYVSDEYYLLAERDIPSAAFYESFTQIENGIGLIRSFLQEFESGKIESSHDFGGFFQWVDGAPPWGYRSPRGEVTAQRSTEPPVLLTGPYGAPILRSLLNQHGFESIEVLEVTNTFFGGTIGVAGLMTGDDIRRTILAHGAQGRYIIPDICLQENRFLDGLDVADLPGAVEVIDTSGASLRSVLEASRQRVSV